MNINMQKQWNHRERKLAFKHLNMMCVLWKQEDTVMRTTEGSIKSAKIPIPFSIVNNNGLVRIMKYVHFALPINGIQLCIFHKVWVNSCQSLARTKWWLTSNSIQRTVRKKTTCNTKNLHCYDNWHDSIEPLNKLLRVRGFFILFLSFSFHSIIRHLFILSSHEPYCPLSRQIRHREYNIESNR